MTKKYQSEQLMICHQDAEALYRIGAISEAEMQEFDRECLVPDPKAPRQAPARQAPASAYAGPRKG
ncbi:MAG: XRE family transcriptional regulator [Treponema sp.]|jgi:DNA-binding transcriptional regulator YiaG|nr:XRE family transcriptional regulator [Treponema sp.]